MHDAYDLAVQRGVPPERLATRCYCGKARCEARLADIERRLARRCRPADRAALEFDKEQAEAELQGGLLHAWRDVRFEIELDKKMVITDLFGFFATCKARRPYLEASGDSCLVAIPVRAGEKRPSLSESFPLSEDTDVARVPDDHVVVLSRLPNPPDPRRNNKPMLNMYVPPRRVAEFDAKETEVEDCERMQQCLGVATEVSRAWLQPMRSVPCPGHPRLERKRKRSAGRPAEGLSPALARHCLPIDDDCDTNYVTDPRSGRLVMDHCRDHRVFALGREDARLAAIAEVIGCKAGLARGKDDERDAQHWISVMATSLSDEERRAAAAKYRRVPWIAPKRSTPHQRRSDEHPAVKAIRKHYPGWRTWDNVPIRWEDIPKEAVPDSYICGRCRNVFEPRHAAEDCPSKDRPKWVPVFERPMPHGLFNVQKLAWSDPVELLERARWVDGNGLPVIDRNVYRAYWESEHASAAFE